MKYLFALMLALAFSAFADEGNHYGWGNQGGQGGDASASADARAKANAGAIAVGVQEANQSASNSQDVSVNTEAQKRNPVSTAYAPTVYPTAPCMGSSSVGGQGITFGFSIGSSWTDTECQIAETARGFEQSGYKEDALFIRCKGKYAKDSPSCVALKQ